MEGSLVHDSGGRRLFGQATGSARCPLEAVDFWHQAKPRRNRVLSKVQTNKRWYYQSLIAGRPNWGQIVAQRTNREAQESRAGAHNEYDQMRVLVLLHPFADSPARQALRKQSQTRCPRCGAWSAADRCPQCGAHRMSAEITVHPGEEEEMQVAR